MEDLVLIAYYYGIYYGIIIWITALLLTYLLSRKKMMQNEILWKNGLVKDIIKLGETDQIAKDLVQNLELDTFVLNESTIDYRKDLRAYYTTISRKVGQMLVFPTIISLFLSHTYITADEVIELRREYTNHGRPMKLVWKIIRERRTNKIPKDFVYTEYRELPDVCQ